MDNKSKMAWLLIIAASAVANAQTDDTWQPVKGTDKLTALFSDTLLTSELGGGNTAVATYNVDGTGELKAWNDTFEREWKVDGQWPDDFAPKHGADMLVDELWKRGWTNEEISKVFGENIMRVWKQTWTPKSK